MRVARRLLLVTACLWSAACPLGRDRDRDDAGPVDSGYPPPATDVTAAIGTDATLDIGTWNVKNFPCGNSSETSTCRPGAEDTPALAADVIASLDLDLVALQEVADEEAFYELADRLPEHVGILSGHTYSDGSYQKIGYLYRATVLSAGAPGELFRTDNNFPRPALQVPFTWTGGDSPFTFLAISVHLKAGEGTLDSDRRKAAISRMEAHARNLVDGAGEDNIIFLGDFNENIRTSTGLQNFAPFLDATRYDVRTRANADAREFSFIPSGVVLDHIVTTSALKAAAGSGPAVIPRLDTDIEGYRGRLSDHLLVGVSLAP
jgi:endonuclease/exonuclease/phosphatase family metal-dependent hydrolase